MGGTCFCNKNRRIQKLLWQNLKKGPFQFHSTFKQEKVQYCYAINVKAFLF